MKVKVLNLLLIVLVLFLLIPPGICFAQDENIPDPITIAVIDLDMEAGISSDYQGLLSDLLREELFNTGAFIVLEREKMEDMFAEQGLHLSGAVSDEKAVEMGKLLGVKSMLAGSVGQIGEMLIISLRLIDVETGKVTAAESVKSRCSIEDFTLNSLREAACNIANPNREASFAHSLENKNISEKAKQDTPPPDGEKKPPRPGDRRRKKEGNPPPGGRGRLKEGAKPPDQRPGQKNENEKMRTLSLKDAAQAREEIKSGNEAMKIGDWDAAVTHFEMATKITPGFVKAYKNLGDAYFNGGHLDKALEAYDSAIKISPLYVDARLARINIWILNDKEEDAENELKRIIEAKAVGAGNHAKAYALYAKLQVKQGKRQEARENFEKAIELDPNNPVYFISLARLFNNTQRFDQAIAATRRALEIDKNSYDAYFLMGQAYEGKNEISEAIDAFKSAEKVARNGEQSANAREMIQLLEN